MFFMVNEYLEVALKFSVITTGTYFIGTWIDRLSLVADMTPLYKTGRLNTKPTLRNIYDIVNPKNRLLYFNDSRPEIPESQEPPREERK